MIRRLGSDFNRLLAASVVSNLGDGVRLAAGPLLVASTTTDPVLVGGAVFVQQVPWLVLSLPAGAFVDRLDRRRVVVAVNAARAVVAGLLAVSLASGTASLPLLYAVLLVVGLARSSPTPPPPRSCPHSSRQSTCRGRTRV